MTIRYQIRMHSMQAHLFEVQLQFEADAAHAHQLWLPTWIPGSYLQREFARHIVSIEADVAGTPLAIQKTDKNHWQLGIAQGVVTVRYLVYAFDLSVRGAYLDQTRAFFNGTSVFLAVAGFEQRPCEVHICAPEGKAYRHWEVATALPRHGAKAWSFGEYRAENYDELIDHPVEIGEFSRISFKACGVPHDLVFAGRHDADLDRLKKDIKKICEAQIRFFGEPAPFKRYVFITMVVGEGYGGLEHRASTALMCSRDDLPLAHEIESKDGYRQFLGLVSHEYFHNWNVKRIKPAAYAPYPLDREAYTRLLWAFEGITSYYDDLFLLRTGLITQQQYLDVIAKAMTQVQRTAGRQVQTLEDSSFDTWIKFYRPDENSPNSGVSYYVKGALVALSLDLLLRSQTQGKCSLDTVMQALWQRFGQDFERSGVGIAEDEWEALAQEVSGVDLSVFFNKALRSTDELPLPELFTLFGVKTQLRVATGSTDKGGWQDKEVPASNDLGIRFSVELGAIKLTHVLQGGAAQAAGLSAGDILVAMDGLRVTASNLTSLLAQKNAGKKRELLAFRRDELMRFDIYPQAALADTWGLKLDEAASMQTSLCHSWLLA